jgi:hypothetical protein
MAGMAIGVLAALAPKAFAADIAENAERNRIVLRDLGVLRGESSWTVANACLRIGCSCRRH